jgi:hypothetical protein
MRLTNVRFRLRTLIVGSLFFGVSIAAITRAPRAYSGFSENARAERRERKQLQYWLDRLRVDQQGFEMASAQQAAMPDAVIFVDQAQTLARNSLEWVEYSNARVNAHGRLKWEFFCSAFFCVPVPARRMPPESATPMTVLRYHRAF